MEVRADLRDVVALHGGIDPVVDFHVASQGCDYRNPVFNNPSISKLQDLTSLAVARGQVRQLRG